MEYGIIIIVAIVLNVLYCCVHRVICSYTNIQFWYIHVVINSADNIEAMCYELHTGWRNDFLEILISTIWCQIAHITHKKWCYSTVLAYGKKWQIWKLLPFPRNTGQTTHSRSSCRQSCRELNSLHKSLRGHKRWYVGGHVSYATNNSDREESLAAKISRKIQFSYINTNYGLTRLQTYISYWLLWKKTRFFFNFHSCANFSFSDTVIWNNGIFQTKKK